MRLGAAQPFGPAADLLHHFTGVALSASTVQRLTVAAGATLQQLEQEETAALPVGGGPPATEPLQLSLDGSMVPLTDGWREVKLLAIGERQPDGALTTLSYAATLGTAETFGTEAEGELVRRGVPGGADVVTVNDGAEWIQGFLDLHCPRAPRVLDFAHAAGYLGTAATEAYGEETEAAARWFTTQRHTLRHGDPEAVLTALDALPMGEERDRARRYLAARRSQISYRDFTEQGWPIGSGCVESAHKGIVQTRLKGRGMRWTQPVASAVLAVRVVEANERWGDRWSQVMAQQRAAQQATTAARRQARRPPKRKLVQDGKPTPDHVWRGFRLRGSPRFPRM